MIKNTEEAVMMLNGETMALNLVMKALIETHPNPDALLQTITALQKNGESFLRRNPPPNIHLFRFEQTLDNLISSINT